MEAKDRFMALVARKTLVECYGSRNHAAKRLGIHRSTLRRILEEDNAFIDAQVPEDYRTDFS